MKIEEDKQYPTKFSKWVIINHYHNCEVKIRGPYRKSHHPAKRKLKKKSTEKRRTAALWAHNGNDRIWEATLVKLNGVDKIPKTLGVEFAVAGNQLRGERISRYLNHRHRRRAVCSRFQSHIALCIWSWRVEKKKKVAAESVELL